MAINLVFGKPGLSSLPCKTCGRDTLHVFGSCNTCGTCYQPEVVRREIGGKQYHRMRGIKDWERRQAKGAS